MSEKQENTQSCEEEKNPPEQEAKAPCDEKNEKPEKSKSKKSAKKDKSSEQEEKLSQELKKQKEAYLRLAAEYDNYRKRTQNEKLSLYDDATAKAVAQILPIADSITMAQANLKDAPQEFVKGIELIENQLKKSFENLKIEVFGEIGDVFDPTVHNAISKIEDEELGENTLSMIYQKGYKIGDKIVRHAMVQVANCD